MNKNLIEKIAPQLTELMIKKMETLTEEWRKPWIADLAHGLPRNLRGTPYRGGNILMLLFLSEIAGYSTPLFMTFKQAKEEGLNILKGSGSFPVFFWKLYIRHKETRKKIELADYYRLPQEQRRQYDVLPVMRYTRSSTSTRRICRNSSRSATLRLRHRPNRKTTRTV